MNGGKFHLWMPRKFIHSFLFISQLTRRSSGCGESLIYQMQKQILLTHSSREKDFEEQIAICEGYLKRDGNVGGDFDLKRLRDKDVAATGDIDMYNGHMLHNSYSEEDMFENEEKRYSFSFIQAIFLWCCKNLGKLSTKMESEANNATKNSSGKNSKGKSNSTAGTGDEGNVALATSIDEKDIYSKSERIWKVVNDVLICASNLVFKDDITIGTKNFDLLLRSAVLSLKSQQQHYIDLVTSALHAFYDRFSIHPSLDVLLLTIPMCENIVASKYSDISVNPFGLIHETLKIFSIVLSNQQPKRSYEILSSKDMIICLYSIHVQSKKYNNSDIIRSTIQSLFSQCLFHDDHMSEFSPSSSIFQHYSKAFDTNAQEQKNEKDSKKKNAQQPISYAGSIFSSFSDILQSQHATVAAFAVSDISLSYIKARLKFSKSHHQTSSLYERRKIGNSCFAFIYEMLEIILESIKNKDKNSEFVVSVLISAKELFTYLNQDNSEISLIPIYDPEDHELCLRQWVERLLDELSSVKIASDNETHLAESLFSMISSIVSLDFRIIEQQLQVILTKVINIFCIKKISNQSALSAGRSLYLQLLKTYNSLRQISHFFTSSELAQKDMKSISSNHLLINLLLDGDIEASVSTQLALIPEAQLDSVWNQLENIAISSKSRNEFYEFNISVFNIFLQSIEVTRHNWNMLLNLALGSSSTYVSMCEEGFSNKNIESNERYLSLTIELCASLEKFIRLCRKWSFGTSVSNLDKHQIDIVSLHKKYKKESESITLAIASLGSDYLMNTYYKCFLNPTKEDLELGLSMVKIIMKTCFNCMESNDQSRTKDTAVAILLENLLMFSFFSKEEDDSKIIKKLWSFILDDVIKENFTPSVSSNNRNISNILTSATFYEIQNIRENAQDSIVSELIHLGNNICGNKKLLDANEYQQLCLTANEEEFKVEKKKDLIIQDIDAQQYSSLLQMLLYFPQSYLTAEAVATVTDIVLGVHLRQFSLGIVFEDISLLSMKVLFYYLPRLTTINENIYLTLCKVHYDNRKRYHTSWKALFDIDQHIFSSIVSRKICDSEESARDEMFKFIKKKLIKQISEEDNGFHIKYLILTIESMISCLKDDAKKEKVETYLLDTLKRIIKECEPIEKALESNKSLDMVDFYLVIIGHCIIVSTIVDFDFDCNISKHMKLCLERITKVDDDDNKMSLLSWESAFVYIKSVCKAHSRFSPQVDADHPFIIALVAILIHVINSDKNIKKVQDAQGSLAILCEYGNGKMLSLIVNSLISADLKNQRIFDTFVTVIDQSMIHPSGGHQRLDLFARYALHSILFGLANCQTSKSIDLLTHFLLSKRLWFLVDKRRKRNQKEDRSAIMNDLGIDSGNSSMRCQEANVLLSSFQGLHLFLENIKNEDNDVASSKTKEVSGYATSYVHLLYTLLSRHKSAAHSCASVITIQLKAIISLIFSIAKLDFNFDIYPKYFEQLVVSCVDLCSEIKSTRHSAVFRHHVVFILSHYLDHISKWKEYLQTIKYTLNRKTQSRFSHNIDLMAFHLIDLCSNRELQQLFANIHSLKVKDILRRLHDEYESSYKANKQA